MARKLSISIVSAATLMLSTIASAQQGPQQARAMLDKAVTAVKADQAVALAMFNKGEGGFRDGDLYPFCFRVADGKTVASPLAVPAGTDIRTLKDSSGKAYGVELYSAAQKSEGEVTEISNYLFPKPGTTAPTFPKVSFVTKVGGLVCGVGYYKEVLCKVAIGTLGGFNSVGFGLKTDMAAVRVHAI
jgi:hypothetical protein